MFVEQPLALPGSDKYNVNLSERVWNDWDFLGIVEGRKLLF